MNKIITLIAMFLCIYLIYTYSYHDENAVICKSSVSFYWKKKRLDLLISQNINAGKGVLSLSAISYNSDKTKLYLDKVISFSYKQNREFYYLKSEVIMDSPQMTMDSSDQMSWLPDFFTQTGETLILKIKPYGNNTWIFYSGNSPLFVCEKRS